MASIYHRKDVKSGNAWRVQIRRKGKKPFTISFSTEEEAKEFANYYEPKLCLGEKFNIDKLKKRWFDEFKNMQK